MMPVAMNLATNGSQFIFSTSNNCFSFQLGEWESVHMALSITFVSMWKCWLLDADKPDHISTNCITVWLKEGGELCHPRQVNDARHNPVEMELYEMKQLSAAISVCLVKSGSCSQGAAIISVNTHHLLSVTSCCWGNVWGKKGGSWKEKAARMM